MLAMAANSSTLANTAIINALNSNNQRTPEGFWAYLSALLERFFCLDAGDRPREWFTAEVYMKAYTICYEYCTLKRDPIPNVPPHMAYFYGESLYRLLDDRIQQIFKGIGEVQVVQKIQNVFVLANLF